MYLLYILKKVTLVQNISWIDTVTEFISQPECYFRLPNYLNPFFFYSIERSIDLKSKKRFFLSILLRNIQIDVYFRRDMNGKRSRWLHTQTHGHDIWFSYKVCGEREKGDEPLPAGFYIFFLKLGSSRSSTARLGERGGVCCAAPACCPPPPQPTPHGSHLKEEEEKPRDRMSTTLTRPFLDSLHHQPPKRVY